MTKERKRRPTGGGKKGWNKRKRKETKIPRGYAPRPLALLNGQAEHSRLGRQTQPKNKN